jgi:hypothetical protein
MLASMKTTLALHIYFKMLRIFFFLARFTGISCPESRLQKLSMHVTFSLDCTQ